MLFRSLEKRPDLLARVFISSNSINYVWDSTSTSYRSNWYYSSFYGWVGPINHRTSVYYVPSYHYHHARIMKQWVGGTGLVSSSSVYDWKLRDKELYNYNDYKVQWPSSAGSSSWLYNAYESGVYGHYTSWSNTTSNYWGYLIGAVVSPTKIGRTHV